MTERRLAILHVTLGVGETAMSWNEFCLAGRGRHDVGMCCFFRPQLEAPPDVSLFGGDGSVLGFVRALRRALAARRWDVIHAHAPHVGSALLAVWPLLPRAWGVPRVATVHSSFPNYKTRNRWLFLPVFARFDRIVCCSQASLDSVPPLHRRLAGARLCMVRNGADVARVARALTGAPARDPRRFQVISVGRLIDVKNPLCLVRAFAKSADAASRLVMLGAGELREQVVAEAASGGVSGQLELRGLVPRDEVFRTLAAADLFVSTSRVEGLPVAVLEAMAAGCPVVLSDIPQHREIARQGDCVPLVPPEDAAGFAREIERIRRLAPAERAALGERCRALATDHFSVEAMHERYAALYRQLL